MHLKILASCVIAFFVGGCASSETGKVSPSETLKTASPSAFYWKGGPGAHDRTLLEYDVDRKGDVVDAHLVEAPASKFEVAALSDHSLEFFANCLPDEVFVIDSAGAARLTKILSAHEKAGAGSPIKVSTLLRGDTMCSVTHAARPIHVSSAANCTLMLFVDQTGRVGGIYTLSSDDKTWAAHCILAASRFRYSPAVSNGRKVPIVVLEPFALTFTQE